MRQNNKTGASGITALLGVGQQTFLKYQRRQGEQKNEKDENHRDLNSNFLYSVCGYRTILLCSPEIILKIVTKSQKLTL